MCPASAGDSAACAPSATRHDLQLGRRLFHLANGVAIATAYALLFSHEQVVHIFGAIACLVYIADRVRIAYPEVVARRAPWVNRLFVRAEEQVREAVMTPFAIGTPFRPRQSTDGAARNCRAEEVAPLAG